MFRSKIVLLGSAVSVAFACVSTVARAESAEALLKRASNAMGAANVKTLRYTAEGTGYTFGQAFVPDAAWPKITVHSQVRTINYDTGSMREDFVLSRAEPKGGGGYPLSGEQKNEWYVSGGHAWNVTGGNPVPGPRFVEARRHQLWITPIGVVKAAMKNKADLQFQSKGGKSVPAVSFTEPGQFMATAYFNDEFLVERVESRIPDPVLGVTTVGHDLFGLPRLRRRQASDADPAVARRPSRARRDREGSAAQRTGRHRDARCRQERHRARHDREGCRRRMVRRRRLAQQRRDRDAGSPRAGGSAAQRCALGPGHRPGQAARARQADPLRDQFTQPLRPLRGPARRGG
jgi:hypothetical protein